MNGRQTCQVKIYRNRKRDEKDYNFVKVVKITKRMRLRHRESLRCQK